MLALLRHGGPEFVDDDAEKAWVAQGIRYWPVHRINHKVCAVERADCQQCEAKPYSMLSIQPNLAAWAWGYRSVVPLLKVTVGGTERWSWRDFSIYFHT